MVGNKIADKITLAATRKPRKPNNAQLPQPASIPKDIYILPKKRQKIIVEIRLL